MNPMAASFRRISTLAVAWRATWMGEAAAAALGALTVLAFAPYGFYPAAIFGLMGLLWLIGPLSWRRAAWRGLLFGVAEFLCGVHWIYISLHDMGGVPPAAAAFMVLALVCIMGLYSAAACGFAAAWSADGRWRGWLLFPAAWTFCEWVRGWFLTGFPWLNLAYSQVDSALSGYAPYVAGFGVSFCVVLSGGLLLAALQAGGWRKAAVPAAACAALWRHWRHGRHWRHWRHGRHWRHWRHGRHGRHWRHWRHGRHGRHGRQKSQGTVS